MAILGVALALVVVVGGGYLSLRNGLADSSNLCNPEEQGQPPDGEYPADHRQWQKPQFALVLSGQMHGYIDPCGCSDPQHGGLMRRYNFVQSLKARNWDVVGIDLGELVQTKGIHAQNLLKHELAVRALAAMNYKVLGIGRNEILTPLGDALSVIWDKNNPHPRPVNLSLAEAAAGQVLHDQLNLRPYEIIATAGPKVGVINMVGPGLRDELRGREKFVNNLQELPKALQAFADAGVAFGVILHHEYPELDSVKYPKGGLQRMLAVEKAREHQARLCAEFCADARKKNPKIPPIQLMMILVEDPEAPFLMKDLGPDLPTRVVEIGHKGKYVGLVGVYAAKDGYRLQYQKVLMSPDWKTPAGKEKDNAVVALIERYNGVLKQRNMLEQYTRMPHPNQTEQNKKGLTATYVGSNACKNCHKEAFKVWEKTEHAHGTETLENLTHPAGRHFDPECMRCHTTGFEHPGGYANLVLKLEDWVPNQKQTAPAEKVETHNKRLRGIGCESCHGPASEHIRIVNDRNPNDAERLQINPYRPTAAERALEDIEKRTPEQQKQYVQLFQQRMDVMNRFCIQCHDSENDVNWGKPGKEVQDKWLRGKAHPLIHRTIAPKNNNGAAAPPALNNVPPIVIEVVDEKKK